jgi:cell division protein FtsI/penicillin-binding protein 2
VACAQLLVLVGGVVVLVLAAAFSCVALRSPGGSATIHNAGDFALGSVPLTRAFAESCNTTFARLGGAHRLADAAAAFGFGSRFDTGVAAYSGDFPGDAEGNSLAEASIGQGKVQATTRGMAVVAAAVDDGTYRSPRLLGRRQAKRLPAPLAARFLTAAKP